MALFDVFAGPGGGRFPLGLIVLLQQFQGVHGLRAVDGSPQGFHEGLHVLLHLGVELRQYLNVPLPLRRLLKQPFAVIGLRVKVKVL